MDGNITEQSTISKALHHDFWGFGSGSIFMCADIDHPINYYIRTHKCITPIVTLISTLGYQEFNHLYKSTHVNKSYLQ